jgi:hypothetical protein
MRFEPERPKRMGAVSVARVSGKPGRMSGRVGTDHVVGRLVLG